MIGINAQVDPNHPGGTETNVLSLLRALGREPREERFVVVAARRHGRALRRLLGADGRALTWPFVEGGRTPGRDGPWSRLHARAGALAPAVAAAYRLYLRATVVRRGAPTARQADMVLAGRRPAAIHFPYALRFETRLPFLYEPWDLQHRHHPQFFSPEERQWRDATYGDGCRRARLVVTATRWVKDDVVAQYGIDPGKIAVIPRGSLRPPAAATAAEVDRFWRRHGLPESFALYPAMTFPHKNHVRLLQALGRLRDDHGSIVALVCTGRIHAPHWPVVEAELRASRLEDQVRFLGPVPDGILTALYQRARFLVFPSLFEGLGLPLLEAMRHDLPILAAASTCVPEVAGGVATLFDGESEEAMTRALLEAVKNPDRREDLRGRRREILARFSWDEAIRTLTACYRAAAGWPLSEEQRDRLARATGT